MTEERHCGYRNYETFTIAVVVDNDRALLERAQREVRIGLRSGFESEAADRIRAWVERTFIDPVCQEGATHHGIAATLCNAALGQVDWLELAREWSKEEGK